MCSFFLVASHAYMYCTYNIACSHNNRRPQITNHEEHTRIFTAWIIYALRIENSERHRISCVQQTLWSRCVFALLLSWHHNCRMPILHIDIMHGKYCNKKKRKQIDEWEMSRNVCCVMPDYSVSATGMVVAGWSIFLAVARSCRFHIEMHGKVLCLHSLEYNPYFYCIQIGSDVWELLLLFEWLWKHRRQISLSVWTTTASSLTNQCMSSLKFRSVTRVVCLSAKRVATWHLSRICVCAPPLCRHPATPATGVVFFLFFFLLCMQLFCVFHCIFIYCRTDCKQTEMEPWMNDKRRDGKTKHKNEPINTNNHEKKKIMNRFWWAACMRGIFRCCCW